MVMSRSMEHKEDPVLSGDETASGSDYGHDQAPDDSDYDHDQALDDSDHAHDQALDDSDYDHAPAGRFFRDFVERTKLGEGSYGTVYKCKHRLDRMFYAIKKASVDTTSGMMPVELALMAKLDHPNIVRYHQSWVDDKNDKVLKEAKDNLMKNLYIQMQYCHKSLEQMFEKGYVFDKKWAWLCFFEILSGLAYLHGKGFGHGDLLPKNIFLDDAKHVKIGDFDLAFFLGKVDPRVRVCSDDRTSLGDAGYRAPELAVKGKLTDKVDIYSLGKIMCTLFYASNGNFEAYGIDRQRAVDALVAGGLPAGLESCPDVDLCNILKRMIADNPLERPTATDILKRINEAGGVKKLGAGD